MCFSPSEVHTKGRKKIHITFVPDGPRHARHVTLTLAAGTGVRHSFVLPGQEEPIEPWYPTSLGQQSLGFESGPPNKGGFQLVNMLETPTPQTFPLLHAQHGAWRRAPVG